jgi:hypothetical protein
MLDTEILIQIPVKPKGLIRTNAIGILNAVNTMLIIEDILGFPIPVNNPFDTVSVVLNICEKATACKYILAILIVCSSLTNNLINGTLKNINNNAIIKE